MQQSAPVNASGSPSPRISVEQRFDAALKLAKVGFITALALNYLPQPDFVTRLAKGPLFMKNAFRNGLIAGIAIPTALIAIPGTVIFYKAQAVAIGGLAFLSKFIASDKDSEWGAKQAGIDLLKAVGWTGVGLAITGLVMRVRVLPKTWSALAGFNYGGMVSGIPLSMGIQYFRREIELMNQLLSQEAD